MGAALGAPLEALSFCHHEPALVGCSAAAFQVHRGRAFQPADGKGSTDMEALGRVELPTNGLGNRCSIHLSYRAMSLPSDFLVYRDFAVISFGWLTVL